MGDDRYLQKKAKGPAAETTSAPQLDVAADAVIPEETYIRPPEEPDFWEGENWEVSPLLSVTRSAFTIYPPDTDHPAAGLLPYSGIGTTLMSAVCVLALAIVVLCTIVGVCV